ncbi:hypothetical protein DW985_23060 [Bacteroides ovatus]|nr:hypothetical protein DW985_23060 [Bacteroides ovatus]RHD22511.1 hypothetical protein DW803_21745 [Bacteroides ovatus]
MDWKSYDGTFLIYALTSEVKADVNFPLYQLSVKIVDIFITPIILDNNIGFLCLYVEIFVTL